jgi:peptide/nickel transport system ATP-binding protein
MPGTKQVRLEVSELYVQYPTPKGVIKAVDGVNFSLKNESLGIAGESACGKSTLGTALIRSVQPPGRIVKGRVMLNDEDLVLLSTNEFKNRIRWKRIAMVFQGAMNALDPVYTVESQMKEILTEHHFDGDIRQRILGALDQVGLDRSVAKRYPHELSGGMKQRVVIAMALLLDPDILIADEPTTALDVLVQAQIINLLKKVRKEKGIIIVLITHDLAIVSELADKIAIMYAGRIVEFGSSADIYRNPKHPYTQSLIGAIPQLRANEKKIRFIKGSPPSLIDPPMGCRFFARCPQAMDACKNDPPEIKTETGYVRCWLYK